jgi:hypothetical protein
LLKIGLAQNDRAERDGPVQISKVAAKQVV